jgi:hypothetical protein
MLQEGKQERTFRLMLLPHSIRRLKIMQEWMDNSHELAKKERISPEAIGCLIMLLNAPKVVHSQEAVPEKDFKKQAKKEAKLVDGVHKLEHKQLAITAKTQALLVQVHIMIEANLKGEREMPEHEEEIPPGSGNIYRNTEPTISLHPIRTKLLALNKDAMKNLDLKNKAIYHARQNSSVLQHQAELNDSRMDNSCVICVSSFKNKQKLRLTPCGHAFHSNCLEPWLLSGKNHCPGCKLELLHTSKEDFEHKPPTWA